MNSGLIYPKKRKMDYVAGAETAIKYEAFTDDWRQFESKKEYQFVPGKYDTMSCTTFSAINSIEAQINRIIQKDSVIKRKLEKLGYLNNGKFEANEWFTAVMSNTTTIGNSIQNVWDSIRKDGLLPNRWGYIPSDFDTLNEWLDKSGVTEAMKEHAKKFLNIFDVKYEWVFAGTQFNPLLKRHVWQAPLTIAIGVCKTWNNPVVKTCNWATSHHAINYVKQDDYHYIQDTYDPINKKLVKEYPIIWALKGVVTVKKEEQIPELPNHKFDRVMRLGERSDDVLAMQKILKREVPYAFKVEPTGYYGWHTAWAVRSFQAKYKLANWWVRKWINGRWTGKKTLAKLNALQ